MASKIKGYSIIVMLLLAFNSNAQIKSDYADDAGTTEFGDRYYIFCATMQNSSMGSLTVTSDFDAKSTFEWEKYDSLSNSFQPLGNGYSIGGDTLQSNISGLDDGCYRVTISAGSMMAQAQAWVLNNWIEVSYTEIPDSSSLCDEFKIWADFEYAPLNVYNTETGARSSVRVTNEFTYQWEQDGNFVAAVQSPYVYELIASDTPVPYQLTITDEFDCTGTGTVNYDSKVPKSEFTYDPSEGEAVLEVTFTNTSINYDSTLWFFYKENFQYSLEVKDAEGADVDSIDFILYDDAPVYSFENSGEYRVKLVTVKINETGNCRDTMYMEPGTIIDVQSSLVDVPNFFSPNADGANDEWVIQTRSLRTMNVRVYNRWGGLVHSWKYSNITSSDYTYEHSVWDGRIGNRMAAPGVYYYVITYEGRDVYKENPTEEEQRIQLTDRVGKTVKETKKGFVHLFREKL